MGNIIMYGLQSTLLQAEIKTTEELIERIKKKLEELRRKQDCLTEYAIDSTLSSNGINRNVYHGKCLIGPFIKKLLDRRAKVVKEMETEFVVFRVPTIVKNNSDAA
jgi:hypothetical protein